MSLSAAKPADVGTDFTAIREDLTHLSGTVAALLKQQGTAITKDISETVASTAPARHHDDASEHDEHLTLDIPAPTAPAAAVKKTKAKRGRASIPSWDEILFGATKSPRDE